MRSPPALDPYAASVQGTTSLSTALDNLLFPTSWGKGLTTLCNPLDNIGPCRFEIPLSPALLVLPLDNAHPQQHGWVHFQSHKGGITAE